MEFLGFKNISLVIKGIHGTNIVPHRAKFVVSTTVSILIPKNYLFLFFFAVFSGTAHELTEPAYPPRPHLMQKEPIDLPNFPRRGTISGVQNVTLYSKIDTVIQFFRWVYKWSLAQGLYRTLGLLFLYQTEPEISTP